MPRFQLSSRLTMVSLVFLSLLVSVTALGWRVTNAQDVSDFQPRFEELSAPEARVLKFGSSTAAEGGTATVPVTLTATGAEFGFSFSANWDPSLLSITGVAGADVLPGATALPGDCVMAINHYGVAAGRLGVYVGCPNGGVPAGTDEVLNLKFTVKDAAVAGTQVPVSFGNTPLSTEVGDSNGNTIAVDKLPGSVAVVGSTSMKSLASIGGRVTTPSGNGLRNATVNLVDPDGNVQTVMTSSFGFYQFDNIESGTTYTLGVTSRYFRFGTREVSLTDSLSDFDFVGLE